MLAARCRSDGGAPAPCRRTGRLSPAVHARGEDGPSVLLTSIMAFRVSVSLLPPGSSSLARRRASRARDLRPLAWRDVGSVKRSSSAGKQGVWGGRSEEKWIGRP